MIPIVGYQKTTLLDYPGHLASTIFFGGCNYRCPFCHNSEILQITEKTPLIEEQEILSHLMKRKAILEGVCITGGEPTLYTGLPDLLVKIKELGYQIKLDTNGSNPGMIKTLYDAHLIDYIAMDIKNDISHYADTCGCPMVDCNSILDSINYIKSCGIDYEFRTTMTQELHTKQNILELGKLLQGSKRYFIQNYRESNHVLEKRFHPIDPNTLQYYLELLKPSIPNSFIRGEA